MEKHLLLGTALLAAFSAFPQAAPKQRKATVQNISVLTANYLASVNRTEQTDNQPAASVGVEPPAGEPQVYSQISKVSSTPVNWTGFTGSMNMFGVLLSETKPLQYDDELNAVTFVHRKSNTYAPSPVPTSVGANTGVLVAMLSQNWSNTWDSTMIYNDNNNWARFPQGGILKGGGPASTSNTNIANAFIAATGNITQSAGGWIGNVFVTKALGAGTYNNIQAPASQTFVANTPPYTAWNGVPAKMDFVRECFQSTDDGRIRALGSINDGGPSSPFRGARLVTGSYVAGNTIWTTDSIIPPARPNISGGGRHLAFPTGMAWSEDGQTGYVWFIGAHTGVVGDTTGANIGFQPIIAMTNDFGNNWIWQSINFNQPSFKTAVLDHLEATNGNPNLTVPFFNFLEGISAVVDSSRNLHLVATVFRSPSADDPDLVNFTQKYINYDGETYFHPHQAGFRPYLFDFHGGGPNSLGYNVTVIDSLSTEGPSDQPTGDGYALNPWLPNTAETNLKIPVDSRIQASRTVDGRYIIYSWAETDTVLTTNSNGYTKWNMFPNVKARLMVAKSSCLSKTEITVSKQADANGQKKMQNKSYNHYVSQKCAYDFAASTDPVIAVRVPHSISFNSSMDPLAPATHYYSAALLEFDRPCRPNAIGSQEANSAVSAVIYPNPANKSAFLAIDLKNNSTVKVSILNALGQQVKASDSVAQAGPNDISLDLGGLSKGIYFVNINADGASGTKKLVIE